MKARNNRRSSAVSFLGTNVRFFVVVAVLLCGLSQQASLVTGAEIKCQTWNSGTEEVVLPEKWINDGYCDCKSGGDDEPDTDACSGREYWPGSSSATAAEKVVHSFQCPQQKNLKLSPSRLNDGICDCCDGADEPAGLCVDDCEAILAAERAEREAFESNFKEGSKKRKQAVQKFNDLKKSVAEQLEQKSKESETIFSELVQVRSKELQLKTTILDSRLNRVLSKSLALATTKSLSDFDDKGLKGFLEPLTIEELVWFIVHACQLSGEVESAGEGTACVPLRLAGLDAAFHWEPKTYKFNQIPLPTPEMTQEEQMQMALKRKELADLLHHNIHNNGKKWTLGSTSSSESSSTQGPAEKQAIRARKNRNHRRLMAADPPDYDGDDGYMGDDMYGRDEDYEDEDEDEYDDYPAPSRNRYDDPPDAAKEEDTTPKEKRDELSDLIKQQYFSISRVALLDEASKLINRITELMKEDYTDDEEEGEGEKGAKETKEGESPEKMVQDPIALTMVKTKLQKYEKQIRRGIDFAISAKVLLDSTLAALHEDGVSRSEEEEKTIFLQLAVGTLNHGKLSTVHIWQILQAIIPELKADSAQGGETCLTPYAAAMCPPKTAQREAYTIPVPAIYKAGELFCEKLLNSADPSIPQQCIGGAAPDSSDIPTEIPVGYMGYVSPEARAEDDALFSFFQDLALEVDPEWKKEQDDIEARVAKLDSDKISLENDMKDLRESVGGNDELKFGADGELHGLKDKCFSVEAGKYIYELCLYGSAAQKDRDGGGGSGTNLGKWKEATHDEETGKRIWKWDNGAKCWNGPARSATAYVTCGAETKVLTAEEPDTCTYEMQVESFIACDADFRTRHGL